MTLRYPRGRSRASLLLLTLLLAVGLLGGAAASAQSADLSALAGAGKFQQILDLLNGQASSDASVVSLTREMQQHLDHQQQSTAQRQQAYEAALVAMDKQLGEERIDDALNSAIEARGLAGDAKAMLLDPRIVQLVERSRQAAGKAQLEGDYLEALSIYRTLDVLYDDQATFRGDVDRAQRHVRMLRLYAPTQFRKLYEARAARMEQKEGQDKPADAMALGDENWQENLKGVSLAMLRQALDYAANRHIYGKGYQPLLLGACDSLLVMLSTPGLEQTFPNLAAADKTDAFRRGLSQLRSQIVRTRRAGAIEGNDYLQKILALNRQTLALPEPVLVYELADGALSNLDDFSSVIWPSDKDAFSRTTQGKFYGVGIQINRSNGLLTVVSPMPNTPAQRARIRAGDVIAQVNGQDTSAWTLDRAVREITGPEGTPVTVGIQRSGQPQLLTINLRRAEIPIESVRGWQPRDDKGGWDYFVDPKNHIGYVRLSQFIPQSAEEIDAAMNQMQAQGGVKALILDLRYNPGGLLNSAVEVSERFIGDGPIVSTVDADGAVTRPPLMAKRQFTYPPIPVAVLVNGGSASAAEIVSGALQDYHRALIVGSNSFGKGSVQDLFPIDGGKAVIKLTTQYYRLPGGRIIHRKPNAEHWGIQPDLAVAMTPQQLKELDEFRQQVDVLRDPTDPQDAGKPQPMAQEILDKQLDPQLEAALLVLQTRLLAPHVVMADTKVQSAEGTVK